jgi:hypothetical protein
MLPASVNENLGSLPRSNRNDEPEERSFKSFDGALLPNRFCPRDERSKERGVDASLEPLLDGCRTNFLSHVQLKGTNSEGINEGSSISLSFAVSNLNYLLNGLSPLPILYVSPRHELRYFWARDERRRLDSLNGGWIQQGEVTLRFRDCMTSKPLDTTHERGARRGCQGRRQGGKPLWCGEHSIDYAPFRKAQAAFVAPPSARG